jgi:beta-xylosidase
MKRHTLLTPVILLLCTALFSQPDNTNVWHAEQGDGTYKNPIIFSDYSDPDVCRVGNDFYMVSSSFHESPGLPVMHSQDLVNWTLIGHAIDQLVPEEHFSVPRHGMGVWAPSIRYHEGSFYIFWGDPDFGIYMVQTTDPKGPWSEPKLVKAGKGLIDPCPLWDDDGRVWLVHALAGSRAGFKNMLILNELSPQADKVLDTGRVIHDAHTTDATLEGPKFYKRNGYYYIFAPAGGVTYGYQLVLRSRSVYGPYERKLVLTQGETEINGPHQGGWVDTPSGEHWFIHFQDRYEYGRIVHMQPVRWENNWPLMGENIDQDGVGYPVLSHSKPKGLPSQPATSPVVGDEFNSTTLGYQWSWNANYKPWWYFADGSNGILRLFTMPADDFINLWEQPNILRQRLPGEKFTLTVRAKFTPDPRFTGEKAGLVMLGMNYASIYFESTEEGLNLIFAQCMDAHKGSEETREKITNLKPSEYYYLRLKVSGDGITSFYYSTNNIDFTRVGQDFKAVKGVWQGSRSGLFATRPTKTNDGGFLDIDWLRLE